MYGYIIQSPDKDYEILGGEIIENDFIDYQSENYIDFYISLSNQNLVHNKILLVMVYENEKTLPINEYIATKEPQEALDFIQNKKHYSNISLQGFTSEIDSLQYLVEHLTDSGINNE